MREIWLIDVKSLTDNGLENGLKKLKSLRNLHVSRLEDANNVLCYNFVSKVDSEILPKIQEFNLSVSRICNAEIVNFHFILLYTTHIGIKILY